MALHCGTRVYEHVPGDEDGRLFWVMANGKVKLYSDCRKEGDTGNYQASADGGGHVYEYKYFLLKDGILTDVLNGKFHIEMATYFNDNKELAELIATKKLKKTNMKEIVVHYNNGFMNK